MRSESEMRARFEAWARPRFSGDEAFDVIEGRPGGWEYNGDAVQAAWAGWQAALASQAQVPEGFVVVPSDPDRRMIVAGMLFGLTPNQACAVFQSMLAAAPAQEVPETPGNEITDEKGRPMTYWGGKAKP